jgi:poly(hydroxyalkanoate) granule-associated protein
MANKRIQRKKVQPAHAKVDAGSLWLAGVGAVSLARKRGAALLGDLVSEGHRLQVKATRLVVEAGSDVQSQVTGMFKPVRAGVARQVQQVGMAVQSGIAGVLAALGIPSKADIDELSHRVGALSRQLKAK